MIEEESLEKSSLLSASILICHSLNLFMFSGLNLSTNSCFKISFRSIKKYDLFDFLVYVNSKLQFTLIQIELNVLEKAVLGSCITYLAICAICETLYNLNIGCQLNLVTFIINLYSERTSVIGSESGINHPPLMFELSGTDDKIILETSQADVIINKRYNKNNKQNFEESLNTEEIKTRSSVRNCHLSNVKSKNCRSSNIENNYRLSNTKKKLDNKNLQYNSLDKKEDSSKYNFEIRGSSSSAEGDENFTAESREEGLSETNCFIPNLSRSEADIKKRVRFSLAKMESGDLNFRVTLSIKNEATGQTVFYKVDKNRFRKEKTIKLMVETLYRIDISFKPTQTLARAIVNGHEVKMTERVHDSTASAYSLHLPTSNVQPTPKGHREEISFLIQLTNGLVLQTSLQTKFYKLSDTQHCEWGSTFHCIEYDCESYSESAAIAVLRETFR